MVLVKMLRRSPSKVSSQTNYSLEQIDDLLGVDPGEFDANVKRVAKLLASSEATLDIREYRQRRHDGLGSLEDVDFPELRDALYSADLKRLPQMDRDEELRMARRHEFMAGLLKWVMSRYGIPQADIEQLVKKPARHQLSAISGRPEPRGISGVWVERMIEQFEDLRNLYVEGALYIVGSTVNRYRSLGVDSQDLVQEGNASLFQAIDGFDWRRDVRFRTYAQYWVQQAVLKMLYNSARTVRVPIWVQKVLGKIRRAQEAGRREGRELSHADIAKRIDVPESQIAWVLSTRRYAVSLDATVGGEESGATLGQMLPDEDQVPVPDAVPPGDLGSVLAEVMADLPDREQGVLTRRFGLNGSEPETLGEIAGDLGITAERVRQLQNAALGRIKRPAMMSRLRVFVD